MSGETSALKSYAAFANVTIIGLESIIPREVTVDTQPPSPIQIPTPEEVRKIHDEGVRIMSITMPYAGSHLACRENWDAQWITSRPNAPIRLGGKALVSIFDTHTILPSVGRPTSADAAANGFKCGEVHAWSFNFNHC